MKIEEYRQMEKEELIAIIMGLTEIVKEQAEKTTQLQIEIAQMREEIAQLKEQKNKNSQNSSKPPSSDGYKKAKPQSLRVKSGKKAGGQEGHEGHGFVMPGKVDEIIYHQPSVCEACGKELELGIGRVAETRYSVDINVEVRLSAHQSTACTCEECGHVTRGSFPEGINSTMQYGESMKSLAVALNTAGSVSINRTHEILQGVFGVPISTGTISGMVKECASKVEPAMEAIKEQVIQSPLVHFDETGVSVNKKTQWAHSASTDRLTYIAVDEKRGREGMNRCAVLPEFRGIAVHDCWGPYFKYDCEHALCNAHLLRELTGVEENTAQPWAKEMKTLLLDMKRAKQQCLEADQYSLPQESRQAFCERYDALLDAGMAANPILEAPPGKRGKPKKGKIRSLLERLETYKAEVCLFVDNFLVPFDNNQAERDIRVFKVKDKVTGGFRTVDGAYDYASITSYLSTARKHGFSIFDSLKRAFAGDSVSILFDSMTE